MRYPGVSRHISSPVSLKMMLDSGSFHYGISNMTGFNLTVYGYRQIGYRAVPDVMIAFAMPH
jgi:hypothetical protein